jgi:chorismate synthase
VAVLEGIPAGLPVATDLVNHELSRRMQGYGRGARMKIEADAVEWLAGIRAGETLGSPIAMLIWNRDWEHWQDVMAPEADPPGQARRRQVTRPRPGHADLAGAVKYDRHDARDVLERASARETAARTACGAVARLLLADAGVEIGSHVVELGGVVARPPEPLPVPLNPAADATRAPCAASTRPPAARWSRAWTRPRPRATRWAAWWKSWCAAAPWAWARTPAGTAGWTDAWRAR